MFRVRVDVEGSGSCLRFVFMLRVWVDVKGLGSC